MLNGKWQVLLLEENKWLNCLSKVDALLIAGAKALEYDAYHLGHSSEEIAQQLEDTATAFERHRLGFGSRYFRRCAERARGVVVEDGE
jgi:hypothetical protein